MSDHENHLTSSSREVREPGVSLRATDVLRFLHQHPAFFIQHPDILAQMTVVDEHGSVTNLLNYQVKVLQDKNRRLKERLDGMLQAARHNEDLVNRVFDLALVLASRPENQSGVNVFVAHVKKLFPSDFMVLALPRSKVPADIRMRHVALIGDETEYRRCFSDVLEQAQPVCGRIKIEKRQYLFGEAATQVASAALVPLGEEGTGGLLAFGSRDQHRFVPGMSTDVLQKLARLLNSQLSRCLAKGARQVQADTK